MGEARVISARRAVSGAVVSALLGASAATLVMTHPFTDEGDGGLRLLGTHHARGASDGHPPPGWSHGDDRDQDGWRGNGVPPGWSHGDKDGWKGSGVPPGWSRHGLPEKHQDAAQQHGQKDKQHGQKDKKHEHDR